MCLDLLVDSAAQVGKVTQAYRDLVASRVVLAHQEYVDTQDRTDKVACLV